MSAPPTRLRLRVVPNASRAEIVGWIEPEVLKIKVTAPPEGGRANREVIALLAQALGVGKRAVTLVAGEKARLKVVTLAGLSSTEVAARLG